jgi:hypothetical protein
MLWPAITLQMINRESYHCGFFVTRLEGRAVLQWEAADSAEILTSCQIKRCHYVKDQYQSQSCCEDPVCRTGILSARI